MKKTLVVFILLSLNIYANDSEYYTSGNQLVPLESSDVRLDKEVLTIRYVDGSNFDVDVKYTLFNEGEARETVIGFESVGQVGEAEPQGFFEEKYENCTC